MKTDVYTDRIPDAVARTNKGVRSILLSWIAWPFHRNPVLPLAQVQQGETGESRVARHPREWYGGIAASSHIDPGFHQSDSDSSQGDPDVQSVIGRFQFALYKAFPGIQIQSKKQESVSLLLFFFASCLLGGSVALTLHAQNTRTIEQEIVSARIENIKEDVEAIAQNLKIHIAENAAMREKYEERVRHLETEAATMRGVGISFGAILALLQGGQLILFRSKRGTQQ